MAKKRRHRRILVFVFSLLYDCAEARAPSAGVMTQPYKDVCGAVLGLV